MRAFAAVGTDNIGITSKCGFDWQFFTPEVVKATFESEMERPAQK